MLDASAVLELVIGSAAGALVGARLADPTESLHAPHLLSVEVAQILRRYVLTGALEPAAAAAALDDVVDLDIERYDHEPLLPRIWELRVNLTSYDAAYVALAEVLDAPLLTLDERLRRAPGHQADIEVVASGGASSGGLSRGGAR